MGRDTKESGGSKPAAEDQSEETDRGRDTTGKTHGKEIQMAGSYNSVPGSQRTRLYALFRMLYKDCQEKVNNKSDDHDLPGIGFSPLQQIQKNKGDQCIQHSENKRPPDDMIITALYYTAMGIDNKRKDNIEKE